ncbi:hypothetical protein [Sphingomonas sp.]|uniref:hypothetical protein n=1 Tax=Sphingomonas sp. TaxID=28214 RepID=UPI002DD6B067|nr:hypothetical protein [Sphingomonas sp.]
MKHHTTPARRAAWLFLAAPALLAVPAIAQDASTAPPPVRVTVPQATPPAAPPPVATTAPLPAQTQAPPTSRSVQANTVNPNSPTTIAPGAGDVVDDARRPAARTQRAAPARQPIRTQSVTRTVTTTAPAAIAPAPAPGPEPLIPPVTVPEAAAPLPVADTTATETTTATTKDGGAPLWPLALVVVAILAAGAFFLMRSRRREAEYEEYEAETTYHDAEPAYVEPVAAPQPADDRPIVVPALATAPTAAAAAAQEPAVAIADDAIVSDAPAEDVAALTDATAPVHNRPWLEFAMRPVRAGTSADEALVEIELTVANAGSVPAKDVRVTTFMLTDAHASEMENMLVDTPADAAIDPVTIDPGEGTRIDATLAALKADLGGDGHFTPVVVADARYTLPDGSEGRTSASFVVGVSDDEGGTLIPIDLADRVMREDIEARLHGAVEHA